MATNYVRASYTEIIDLQTVNGQTSIVGIHTPTGKGPYEKLAGFFTNYRKYRYKGISKLMMVPAANLPVDPLGLTGVQGTTDLMDPRDALNPIMFHGCHGENMSNVIDNFYANHSVTAGTFGEMNPTAGYISSSADKVDSSNAVVDNNYYRFLTDPTWRKFGIQSGVNIRNLHPLTWRVARSVPLLPGDTPLANGIIRGTGDGNNANVPTTTTLPAGNVATYPVGEIPAIQNIGGGSFSRAFVQEFTNGVSRLGWLPTTTFGNVTTGEPSITVLPKLFMGMLVLPPAYNVEQFFRLSIRHVFEFKDFTMSLGLMGRQAVSLAETPNVTEFTGYYNWIDYTADGAKVAQVSEYNEGTTLDCINAKSEVISDGVN